MIKLLLRIFIKITGFPIFYVITRQKKHFSNLKAKEQFYHPKKEGVIYVSNHTSILDFTVFFFLHLFRNVKTFAAEVMYRDIPLRILNWILGNVRINRNNVNFNSLLEAEKCLNNNNCLLIFPEGHIEKKKGQLEKFYESAIVLAFRTHSAIIPHYTIGQYNFIHRNRVIIGEKIYVNELIKKDVLEKSDIEFLINYLYKEVSKLKTILDNINKYKIQTVFTKKYWFMDLAKFTTLPHRFISWHTKRIYIGNKKEVKRAFKYRCLLTANHTGVTDVFFFYLYFFTRRIRIIASNKIYDYKFFSFCLKNSGVIRFNVIDHNNFDYVGFKEALNTLEGNGVVGIFPEGHIEYGGNMMAIREGLATLSLLTNSPIIPIYFANVYRYLKNNKVFIGEVIYPPKNIVINKKTIADFNDKIIKAFSDLENIAKKYK